MRILEATVRPLNMQISCDHEHVEKPSHAMIMAPSASRSNADKHKMLQGSIGMAVLPMWCMDHTATWMVDEIVF